jgi:glycosyltransferase involved in cell wall biosynthesis
VIAPGSPVAAADAIRHLANGEADRVRMGEAGREKAERLWSWPRLLDRMDEAYSEALGEHRARTS